VFDPVTITGQVENLAFINQPVKNRRGDDGIAEEINPVIKSFIGSNDE